MVTLLNPNYSFHLFLTLQRQNHTGFQRIEQLSRPNSGTINRIPATASKYILHMEPVEYETNNNQEFSPVAANTRPSTAAVYRASTGSFKLLPRTESNRPTTAGALRPKSVQKFEDTLLRAQSSTKLPKYVELDKKVCRFFGHFYTDRNWDEDAPLGDPKIEKYIGHKLTILYYLVDDTIEISQPPVINSGIQGGIFFRRGAMTKNDGEPLRLIDFSVGQSVHTLGREIFITDADHFTRNYFRYRL